MSTSIDPLNWDDVRIFLAVLEAPTLKLAAHRLGVNPSTVGRRLGALEASLGVVLFERGRRGIEPTLAATELAESARHLRRAARAFTHTAANLDDAPRGSVVLTAPTNIANLVLVPLIADLRAAHPDLQISIDTDNAYADLDGHGADIALRGVAASASLPGGENLIARKLAVSVVVPVASSSYAESVGIVSALDDIDWVLLDGYTAWSTKITENVSPSRIALRSADASTVVSAVESGVGATWMNRIFAGPRLVELELAPPLQALLDAEHALWLVTHRSLRNVPRVAAVWEFLTNKFESSPG